MPTVGRPTVCYRRPTGEILRYTPFVAATYARSIIEMDSRVYELPGVFVQRRLTFTPAGVPVKTSNLGRTAVSE